MLTQLRNNKKYSNVNCKWKPGAVAVLARNIWGYGRMVSAAA